MQRGFAVRRGEHAGHVAAFERRYADGAIPTGGATAVGFAATHVNVRVVVQAPIALRVAAD